METSDFQGLLMPASFRRRWTYNELLPSILYFGRITFLMDDIEEAYITKVVPGAQTDTKLPRLLGPTELLGVPDEKFCDGLTAEQHRYYWPMRELMREKVILITSMDLSLIFPAEFEELAELPNILKDRRHPQHGLARDYHSAAKNYYNAIVKRPAGVSDETKIQDVYRWIRDALRMRTSADWQRVFIDPAGFKAFKAAVGIFPSLYELNAKRTSRGCYEPRASKASFLSIRQTNAMR